MYKIKQNKYWTIKQSSYLTLVEDFGTFEEAINYLKIDNNETNKLIYDTLYATYGYVPLVYQSIDVGGLNLGQKIMFGAQKYDMLKDLDYHVFEETDSQEGYNYGEVKPGIDKEDIKFLVGGIKNTKTGNLVEKYEKYEKQQTLLNKIIDDIISDISNSFVRF